jgi:hypothetical protein
MICGGHVQASFPFFFYSYLLFPIPFLFFPPVSLFISPDNVLCPPAALLQFSRCRICSNGRVYATSTSDLAPSHRLVMRGAGPQVQRLTPCLAPHHSGVELYSRTPRIRDTGCGGLGLAPLSSGLQFSLQTIPLTSHQPPLSLPFTPFPLLKPSLSLSPPTIRLLGQSTLPLIPTRSPASPFHLPCSNCDVLPFYPSTTFTRLP